MVLATFALWVAWRVSEGYLEGEKRVAGLLLLTFIPFFNFHALKYNANTVLIPLWALVTWFFLRSYETRSVLWAALAGAAAAAAMMGKYWSVFLLAGLGIAALADPRRAQYFRSAAPWVTIAVGAILFAPHVAWLVGQDFAPFTYAVVAHQSTLASAARSGLGFLLGIAGYIAPAVVLSALVTRPSMAAIADTLWPREPARRFALIAFLAPLLLPAFAAMLLKVDIVSLWAMCAMTLLPVVLLSSPLVTVARRAATWLLAAATAFPVVMVLAAPFIAVWIHREGLPNYATHYRLLAQAIDRTWHANVKRAAALPSAATPTSSTACRSIQPTSPRRSTSSIRPRRHGRMPQVSRASASRWCAPRRKRSACTSSTSAPATCRATPSRSRAATGASPTSRCATSSWWRRPQNENAPPRRGIFGNAASA